MSYAYDVMSRVWAQHIRPNVRDKTLALCFEMLIEEMHNANHRVPSANNVFKGDGINKDPEVTRAARALDDYAREKETS